MTVFTIGAAIRPKKGRNWFEGRIIGYSHATDKYRIQLTDGSERWAAGSSLSRYEPIMTQDELMDEAEFMLNQGEPAHQLPTILNRNWEVLLRVAKKTGRTTVLERMVAASEAERVRTIMERKTA